MRWYHALGILSVIVLLALAWALIFPHYVNECAYQYETYEKRCADVNVLLILFGKTADIVERYAGAITAVFTIVLAVSTVGLWISTSKLWSVTDQTLEHAENTAERQLRAYIGIQNGGTKFEEEWATASSTWRESGPVKIFTVNYGRTPAHNATMYVHTISGDSPTAPLDDGMCRRVAGPQIIHPGQNFGKIVGKQRGHETFFIYGYVDYVDAFDKKWRYRFAFSHDPKRYVSESKNDRWIAHDTHNDEQERT